MSGGYQTCSFPDKGKIWTDSGPKVYYTMPNFTVNGTHYGPYEANKRNLQLSTGFWPSSQICHTRVDKWSALNVKFHPNQYILSSTRGKKPQILPIFNFILWWRHLSA